MRGFSAYQLYNALNLHFGKTDYDYFKYHGKTRVTEESFAKNRFKWQFMGIERDTEHLLWYFYLKFKENDFTYVPNRQMFRGPKEKSKHPEEYMKTVIGEDLYKLSSLYGNNPEEMFTKSGLYPDIFNRYKKGDISLETILLIDMCIEEVFNTNLSNDTIAWPDEVKKAKSVSPFVNELFDRNEFMDLFVDRILTDK